ncbi:uncharacterized protein [Oscarella lobularis]|uniref:uncharacterized protein n=1 Tax=Oscarella lobularis TaxID=121494 RepID=UPI003313D8FB
MTTCGTTQTKRKEPCWIDPTPRKESVRRREQSFSAKLFCEQAHVCRDRVFRSSSSSGRPRTASAARRSLRQATGGDFGAFRNSPRFFAKDRAPKRRSQRDAVARRSLRLGARWRALMGSLSAAPPLAEKRRRSPVKAEQNGGSSRRATSTKMETRRNICQQPTDSGPRPLERLQRRDDDERR